jgi:hypothetical protein
MQFFTQAAIQRKSSNGNNRPLSITLKDFFNANSNHSSLYFRQKIGNLLCMHKKHTEYRFELWYISLKILYLYI